MRRSAFLLLVSMLGALLAACGQAASPSPSGGASAQSALVPVLAVSELAVGPNRLAFGVLKDGTPINDPNLAIGLRFFYLDGEDKEVVQSESQAVYRAEGLPFGLYAGYATLDKPGGWGTEVSIPQ